MNSNNGNRQNGNRQLWKRIGTAVRENSRDVNSSDNSHPNIFHYESFSSIKDDNRDKKQSFNNYDQKLGIYFNKFQEVDSTSTLKNQNAHNQNYDQNDVDMISCESQVLEGEQSHQIDQFIKERDQQLKKKNRLNKLKLNIERLQKTVGCLRNDKNKLINLLNELQQTQDKMYDNLKEELKGWINNIQKRSSFSQLQCLRCLNSKKMIQNLTKQCWEIQAKLEEQEIENRRLNLFIRAESFGNFQQKNSKEVQVLKKQIEALNKQTENQEMEIEELHEVIRCSQKSYKSNLLLLSREMEKMRDDFHEKIELVNQKNKEYQRELELTQQRNDHIEQMYQAIKQKYQANTIRAQPKFSHEKSQKKYHVYSHNFRSSFNDSKNRSREQDQVMMHKGSERTITNKQYNSYIKMHSPSKSRSKQRLESSMMEKYEESYLMTKKRQNERTMIISNLNLYNNSGVNLNRIVKGLTQIQRDVRKQLNKSKQGLVF